MSVENIIDEIKKLYPHAHIAMGTLPDDNWRWSASIGTTWSKRVYGQGDSPAEALLDAKSKDMTQATEWGL